MSGEFWSEARRLAEAGAVVAAVAGPVGIAAWLVARSRARHLLPPCRPWRVPWTGFELVAAFVILGIAATALMTMGLDRAGFFQQVYGPDFPRMPARSAPPHDAAAAVAGAPAAAAAQSAEEARANTRALWSGVLALPIQLGLLFVARRVVYPRWRLPRPVGLSSGVALGALAWAALTPFVLIFHVGVLELFRAMNWETEEHPLTQFRGAGGVEQVLFLVQACVAAPLVEEILFRGALLPWVIGARGRPPQPGEPPVLTRPSVRPWVVIVVGMLVAAKTRQAGPMVFAAVLAAGLGVIWVAVRRGRRHWRAVYVTAALFALVHSAVWPSPVPLFVLALGLGYLAVRARGVLVPFVVHGLFNAVSAVYLLRGGAG